MKTHLLLIFLCIFTSMVHSFENQFEETYPLYGIDNLTDQAMVRSPEGDDYFFGIQDGDLIVKKKNTDSDFFDDFYLDFGDIILKETVFLESVIMSNNQPLLLAVISDGESFKVITITFKEDLSYEIEIIIDQISNIESFGVEKVKNDSLIIILKGQEELLLYFYDNDNSIITNLPHNITGLVKNMFIINNSSIETDLSIFCETDELDLSKLWYVSIVDKVVKSHFLKICNSDELYNIQEFYNLNYPYYFTTSNQEKTIYWFEGEKCNFHSYTSSSEKLGYYSNGTELFYCILIDNKLFKFGAVFTEIDSSHFEYRQDILYFSYEDSIIRKEADSLVCENLENFNQRYEIVVDNYEMMNQLLLIQDIDGFLKTFKLYFFTYDTLYELMSFNSDAIIEDYKLSFDQSFLRIGQTDMYIDSLTFQLFESEITPTLLDDYVLYRIESGYVLEMIR